MTLTKYRMIVGQGYIETLDLTEAETHGNYIIVTEQIIEDNEELTEKSTIDSLQGENLVKE